MGEFHFNRVKKVRGKRDYPTQLLNGDVIEVNGVRYVVTNREVVK